MKQSAVEHFQNPQTDREVCYLKKETCHKITSFLSESTNGSRSLLPASTGTCSINTATFRILKRIEKFATPTHVKNVLNEYRLSESSNGSRSLLPRSQ